MRLFSKTAWIVVSVLAALSVPGLWALFGIFGAGQPGPILLTRAQARAIANREARLLGIDVDAAWVVVTLRDNTALRQELPAGPGAIRQALQDPVLAPRLYGYRITYFRKGLEKWPEFGYVNVALTGEVTGARRKARAEEAGGKPEVDALRPVADGIAASRSFTGAPGPVFHSVRPTVFSARNEHVFRYRVEVPSGPRTLDYFVSLFFIGDTFAGWDLIEEYRDGRNFRYRFGSQLAAQFGTLAGLFGLLFALLVAFLKKYHAGEVGVGIGAVLFCLALAASAGSGVFMAPAMALHSNLGDVDAWWTAVAMMAFRSLFYDIPFAILVFLGWSVGESYARERWGQRLASFDALIRFDLRNATVGRSILFGMAAAPLLSVLPFLPALAPVLLGEARLGIPQGSEAILSSLGGPATVPLRSVAAALGFSVTGLLFGLSWAARKLRLPLGGAVIAVVAAILMDVTAVPVEGQGWQYAASAALALGAVAIFLAGDLLSSATAVFFSGLLLALGPLLMSAHGPAFVGAQLTLLVPLAGALCLGFLGLVSGRDVGYKYEDLAPHVKRIIERERVKAEIDAANRIQMALLPARDHAFTGLSVAAHYGAATEIGGDYYDFIPLEKGVLGIALGDVAGHGLTSGIVMSMVKSALIVQTGYDASPCAVLSKLNGTLVRIAPRHMLMTFFFGLLDQQTGVLRFSSAGHLDPYVYRAGTGKLEALSCWGFPLGVHRREPFREQSITLEPRDHLVLYSDGFIEATNDEGDPFGFERFESVIARHGHKSAEAVRQALLEETTRFTRNKPPEDDQTLVVLQFHGHLAAAA